MSSFTSKAGIKVEIDERPDEWIEIRKLSFGAREALKNEIIRITGAVGGADPAINMNVGYLAELMKRCVVGWRLLDDDGNEVPFKRDLIDELDPDDPLVDAALQRISEINPTPLGRPENAG